MKNQFLNERTVSRGRGCWGCRSFETGELAKKHFNFLRIRDKKAAIAKGDYYDPPLYDKVSAMIDAGGMGICLKGCGKGDIKHYGFLCKETDNGKGWEGRDGSSLAIEGHPIDEPSEHLQEQAEDLRRKNRMID